jgi:hypothetical protein
MQRTGVIWRAPVARIDEWPAWQRWGIWMVGWILYLGAFWLLFVTDNVAARTAALAGICVGLLVLTYSSRAVLNERVRKIDRRQLHVILPAFLVYMLLMLYVFPREAHIATPWLKAIVVLSPLLPLLFVAWAMIRYVNGCDEMERRQHLEAAGIAVVLVAILGMGLGLLASAKLIVLGGTLVLLLVLPTLCMAYGLACTWMKWRNRAR